MTEGDPCPVKCGGTINEDLVCTACGSAYLAGQILSRAKYPWLYEQFGKPPEPTAGL
jgi:hypothetical protein